MNERRPVYRRAWFWLAAAAVLVISLLRVLVWANGPDGAHSLDARRFMQSRELFERAAAELLAMGETEIELPGVKDIRVWGEGGEAVVEFTTGGFGLAPSGTYHGVYYSADGEPAAFQNTDVPLGPSREGWIWHGEGDNYGETRHISGSWYTFYASF